MLAAASSPLAAGAEAGNAEAHPAVDFTGTWRLDVEKSRSAGLDAMMTAQGLSGLEQAVARRTSVTQIVEQRGREQLTIGIRSTFKDRDEQQYLDGRHVAAEDMKGNPLETWSQWDESGTAVVTVVVMRTARGEPATMTMTRSLPTMDTMRIHTVLEIQGNARHEADRWFDRAR